MDSHNVDVVIIGGGATGAGILRDLSMRGISAMLLEQGDLAHGTSSRFHGLLHSGGRYVVNDPLSAKECAQENAILKRIAKCCIKDSGGWYVQTTGDNPEYTEKWLKGCKEAGVAVIEVPREQALTEEPLLDKGIKRVFSVPDGVVDGFKLIWANAKSAKQFGGEYRTYHKVQRIICSSQGVLGVAGKDLITGELFTVKSRLVINASGAWASEIAASAGARLTVIKDKGALLAFNHRLFKRVINRLRPPGDGDIFVPHETITILGSTSEIVNSAENNTVRRAQIDRLLTVGSQIAPSLYEKRIIRGFAGVRPLYTEKSDVVQDDGREMSRAFGLVDHGTSDGIHGLLSIVGGKFTTYRLMAERASDWAAKKLNNHNPCLTATECLERPASSRLQREARKLLPFGAADKLLWRLGKEAGKVLHKIRLDPAKAQILCECEMVSLAEVEYIISDADTHCLADLRRKTRLGMGTCQGAFCTYRALGAMFTGLDQGNLRQELRAFLNQRWKGIRPVLWQDQLRETELARALYLGLLDLSPKGE